MGRVRDAEIKALKTMIVGNVRTSRGGWAITETMLSLTLLGMLIGGLVLTQRAVGEVNAVQLLRQQCIAAGQAQLDSIAATGEAIAANEFNRLWPGIRCSVAKSPGKGDWAGLTLVEVVTTTEREGWDVEISLARYVAAREVH